jgi:hypothetical protein
LQTDQLLGDQHSLRLRAQPNREVHVPVVPHQRVRTRLGRVVALTVAVMFAIPAAAFASSCPAHATTAPFTQWGDTGSYFPLPGGNFESPLSASGWTVHRAERTLGNEPFSVGGSSDSYSMTIEGGGIAVSPAFCIDGSMPYLRFFARALGADGNLDVRLVVQPTRGVIAAPFSQIVDLTAGSMTSWAPTGQLNLAAGQTVAAGQSALGRLVFAVAGRSSWQIDDIYADPYRMG